jgi:Ca2+-binding RTX toxin-like protein
MATATELPIDTSATAVDMAETIFGPGVQIVSATYTGDPGAAGIYSDAQSAIPGVVSGDSGVILSTGQASDFTNSDGSTDTNQGEGSGTDNAGVDGDADLDALSGQDTFDGAILEASFVPDGDYITMQFVFTSEEYPEYVAQGVNDTFGVWVNGQFYEAQVMLGGYVSIDSVNQASNGNLYRDNGADAYNTEMDGLTYTLAIKAPVNPGEVNTIKIAIADGGDSVYDSNVLIMADSVQTVTLAVDDSVQLVANATRTVDVLANDHDLTDTGLTITQIMGQDVAPGDTITLASGEQVTLNPDGTLTVISDGDIGANVLTYAVTDGAGNTDIGYLTISTVTVAGPDGIVQGTAGGDLIDIAYAGDPDGDLVDNADAIGVGGTTGDDDYVMAGAGDDTVLGGAADDIVYAEEGDDQALGGVGNDVLSGGAGNDSLAGEAGDDRLYGGAGSDTLTGGAGTDALFGGADADVFAVGDDHETDSLYGGETGTDQDEIWFGNFASADGVEVIFTGAEAGTYDYFGTDAAGEFSGIEGVSLTEYGDSLDAAASTAPVMVEGLGGDDSITGSSAADTISGGDGADVINGEMGGDSITGGAGDDVISSGPDYPVIAEYAQIAGPSQTVTGTNGNPDFDHSVTSDAGTLDQGTVQVDGGYDLAGYHVGNGADANETHSHSFTQEVAGAELTLVEIDPEETVVIWLDGVAIDLNDAVAAGIVSFDPGTTGFVIDGDGAVAATGSPVSQPVPAVITILVPFTEIAIQNLSATGEGNGTIYDLWVDTNPPALYAGDDDTVSGEDGADLIAAGAGNDLVYGGADGDTIDGGIGDDRVEGDAGDDSLSGGDGDDTLLGGADNDALAGGEGADDLDGGTGDDLVAGEGGDDTLTGGAGADTLQGGDGDDLITDLDGASTAEGGAGSDTITTGSGEDVIDGGADDDLIDAGAGADLADGGLGADTVLGGAGDDTISGGADQQVPFGAAPDYAALTGAAGTLTGTNGNGDVSYASASDAGSLAEDIGTIDDGFGGTAPLSGYLVGDGGATGETHSHSFGAEVGSVELQIIGLGVGETLVFTVDGQPIDLNTLIDQGLVGFNPGSTPIYVDGDGNLASYSDAAGPFTPAILTIYGPLGELTVQNVAPSGGDGALYAISADTNPAFDLLEDGADSLEGGAGNDLITGGTGADSLYGGDDRDMLQGSGDDQADGGEGGDDYDTLVVNDVASFAYGGGDNEAGTVTFNDGSTLTFENIEALVVDGTVYSTGDGTVDGTAGNDAIGAGYVDAESDEIDGADGDDDVVSAGAGNDTVDASAGADTVSGGEGADLITGGAGDVIDGGEGGDDNDTLVATGVERVDFDPLNAENGTILFDDGTTLDFTNVEHLDLNAGTPDGTVWGTSGDDSIGVGYVDGDGDIVDAGDAIHAGAGPDDDEIFADAGHDTVFAGLGDDDVYGGDGNDALEGAGGNDYMQGDAGNDEVSGGEGDDFQRGDAGNDIVYGGAGNDSVYGGADDDSVFGGDGDDYVFGGYGTDTVFGGAGNDTITGSGGNDIVQGDDGDDLMQGSDGADTLYGGAGADTMLGEEDGDTFYGGAGDYVDGYETVTTGSDNDTLYVVDVQSVSFDPGNPENGTITFNGGGTLQFYNIENLYVDGTLTGAPDGIVTGSDAAEVIDGSYAGDTGGDVVDGGDALLPGAAPDDDVIEALDGDDTVLAGAGDDLIHAGAGDDNVSGGAGNDTLEGGAGNDALAGDAGDDVFAVADGFGNDTVTGGETDEATGDVLDASVVTAGVVLDLSAGDPANGEDGTLSTGAPGETITFAEVETVLLGAGDDSVTGSAGADRVETGAGADTVDGGAGDDAFDLGAADGAADTVVFADGDGADVIDGFEAPVANGDGTFTGFDLLDVSDLTDADGHPVNTADVAVSDTNGDGTGDAILTFPNGESITLVGVPVAAVSDPAALEAIGIPAAPLPDHVVEGTAGDDLIDGAYTGDPEDDRVDAGDAADGSDDDLIEAYGGNDQVFGLAGNDTIDGGSGNDALDGGTGDDLLAGGAGDDALTGGAGNDTLVLGDGADLAAGGDDRDTFVLGAGNPVGSVIDGGEGGDDVDTLDLSGYADGTLTVTYEDGNAENGVVEFFDGGGASIGTLQFSNIENVIVPCFTPGARIATDLGEVRVESLQVGDRVLTRDHGYQVVRWIGNRCLTAAEVAADPRFAPVRIGRGALGLNLPERDLIVSPQHRMLLSGSRAELMFGEHEVLVAAVHLVDRPGVSRAAPDEVTYIHVLFDRHEIIRANGAWTESYQPGEMTLNGMEDAQRDEILSLFPELRQGEQFPPARLTLKKHEAMAFTAA